MTDDEQTANDAKISESTTAIVIALILLFPLGLYWTWKHPNWPTSKKWAFAGSIAALLLIGSFADDKDKSEPQADKVMRTVKKEALVEVAPVAKHVTEYATKSGGNSVIFELAPLISEEIVLKDFTWHGNYQIKFKLTWKKSLKPGGKWLYTVFDSDGTKLVTNPLIFPNTRLGDTVRTDVILPDGEGSRIFIHY